MNPSGGIIQIIFVPQTTALWEIRLETGQVDREKDQLCAKSCEEYRFPRWPVSCRRGHRGRRQTSFAPKFVRASRP